MRRCIGSEADRDSLLQTLAKLIAKRNLQASEECVKSCLDAIAKACLDEPLNTQVFFEVPNAFDEIIQTYLRYPEPKIKLASCRIVASCNKHVVLPNLKMQKRAAHSEEIQELTLQYQQIMRWALTHTVEMLYKIHLDKKASDIISRLKACATHIDIITDLIEDSKLL